MCDVWYKNFDKYLRKYRYVSWNNILPRSLFFEDLNRKGVSLHFQAHQCNIRLFSTY